MTFSMRNTYFAALFCLTFTQPLGAQQVDSLPPTVVGCFRVDLGAWRPAMDLRGDSVYTSPPVRIEIRQERGSRSSRGEHIVRPAPGEAASVHRFSWARKSTADSITLVWSNGFSGINLTLAVREDTLSGFGRTFWDFPRSAQVTEARLVKVRC